MHHDPLLAECAFRRWPSSLARARAPRALLPLEPAPRVLRRAGGLRMACQRVGYEMSRSYNHRNRPDWRRQRPDTRRVSLSELQADGPGISAGNPSPQSLPRLPVERSRRRPPGRSQLRVRRPDGTHCDLGAVERGMVTGASLQCVRLPEKQPNRRRRQCILVDVTRGAPGRTTPVSSRCTGPTHSPVWA